MTEDRMTDRGSPQDDSAGAASQGEASSESAARHTDEEGAGHGVHRSPGGTADESVDDTTVQLESLQSEIEMLNDRHLRLAAEFDNYRKRIERERAQQRTRTQAELVGKLLEVLDDLQRVSHYDPETTSASALLEGVDLLEKKLRRALESAGLEPVDAEGEFFNPEVMEAIMTVPAEHPEEDGVVADVFQKGYRFKEILIRPARVRVKKYEE